MNIANFLFSIYCNTNARTNIAGGNQTISMLFIGNNSSYTPIERIHIGKINFVFSTV